MERNFKRISDELKLPQESRDRIRSQLTSYQKQSEDISMEKNLLVAVDDVVTEKDLVLTQATSAKKRRVRSLKVPLLAAALAVGCVLSIAAGLPAQVYHFVCGSLIAYIPNSNISFFAPDTDADELVILEDGRLWLDLGGERQDITDLVDENTPYIQENIDPETGEKGYIIAGGTPDHFGWVEIFVRDNVLRAITGTHYEDYFVTLSDGSEASFYDLTDEQQRQVIDEQVTDEDCGIDGNMVRRPWYEVAMRQLGLDY